jgi:glutamate racemase
MSLAHAPIGVFDSGIGGLSVLQALRHELPHEHFVYVADSGHAPYGERGDAFVQARTHAIAQFLRQRHAIKGLVIACNTATAAAVESLRAAMPDLPLIGVEPAIKPAAASSQTHEVGVIATRGTVESRRFKKLIEEFGGPANFHVQACDGLASAIERSSLESGQMASSATEVAQLCARYLQALGPFGLKTGQMDTLVLGCTHYIFIKDELRALLGPDVQLVDTGAPVARQTRRLLDKIGALRGSEGAEIERVLAGPLQIQLLTTGSLPALQAAAARWLALPPSCCAAIELATPQTLGDESI